MASEPDSDGAAQMLEDNWGVGRIIGAIPSTTNGGCDIELAMILASDLGVVLRHVVMDIDRLSKTRDSIFVTRPRPLFPHTDQDFSTVEDGLLGARALTSRSTSVELPALSQWLPMGGPFEDQLKRHVLRLHVPWLPDPPRALRLARSVLTWAWAGVVLVLTIWGVGAEVTGGDAGMSIWDLFGAGLTAFAVLGLVVLVVFVVDTAKDRRERRRHPGADSAG